MANTAVTREAKRLANQIFTLEDPWRQRFLNLLARRVTGGSWDEEEEEPIRADVEAWLCASSELRRSLRLMLTIWEGGRGSVKTASLEEEEIRAAADAPEVAICSGCGTAVDLRSRNNGDGRTTWYYRHRRGEGRGCPQRAGRPGDY